jgi:long-chain acyl-CoA synthetase
MAYFNNLVEMFFSQAEKYHAQPLLWHKTQGAWQPRTWAQVARDVNALAHALRALGVKPGERVMLVSENRPEFCIADVAIMAMGGITVPTYTTNTAEDHAHILRDSGASAVFVSNSKIAKTLLPALVKEGLAVPLISFEPLQIAQTGVFSYHELKDVLARHYHEPALPISKAKRGDLACLIYTSGTSGAPRGVMQSHGGILSNCEAGKEVLFADFPKAKIETFLSFLPLSHAMEHTAGQFLPMVVAGQVYYAEGLDKLGSNIDEVKPTVMIVVPRLFEMLRGRIMKGLEKQGKLARGLFSMALKQGKPKGLSVYSPAQMLLNATVRRKVKARLGGRIKVMVSGGAPLNAEVGSFFESLGVVMLQAYGLTETSPVLCANRPSVGIDNNSVGRPVLNYEVRIAEDGEILARGENLMLGYWNRPKETEAALVNGWLHTGDIGYIDTLGRVVITDRKKDIIVNDKGDNVSPQKVEGMLCLAPEIFQAMVVGDKRPHLTGLVVPDPEWAHEWAKAQGLRLSVAELCQRKDFHAALQAAVDDINTRLSVIDKVRKITLTPEPFTIENEMLTPSIKIRRHKIKQVYKTQLDALY